MCGILAALLGDPDTHVNQLIVDGLTVLQHRGQGKSVSDGMGGVRVCVCAHVMAAGRAVRVGSTARG